MPLDFVQQNAGVPAFTDNVPRLILRTDDVNGDGSLVYVGYAPAGAADTDTIWAIQRVQTSGVSPQVKTNINWAWNNTTAQPTVLGTWNNRAAYTYK